MTLRDQLFDVCVRRVNSAWARHMRDNHPMAAVEYLAGQAWLKGWPEDHDTAVLRAVALHYDREPYLSNDEPGIP